MSIEREDLIKALKGFNEIVLLSRGDENFDMTVILHQKLGFTNDALDALIEYVESIEEDDDKDAEVSQQVFMAGIICGALIMDEVQFAEVLPFIPDAPPPDLAA